MSKNTVSPVVGMVLMLGVIVILFGLLFSIATTDPYDTVENVVDVQNEQNGMSINWNEDYEHLDGVRRIVVVSEDGRKYESTVPGAPIEQIELDKEYDVYVITEDGFGREERRDVGEISYGVPEIN